MKLIINGEKVELAGTAGSVNISQILVIRRVETPDMVSVQLNGEFVDKADWPATFPKEGDEVEFLYFMGGGAGARA